MRLSVDISSMYPPSKVASHPWPKRILQANEMSKQDLKNMTEKVEATAMGIAWRLKHEELRLSKLI